MIRRHPRFKRTYTLCPYTTHFRSTSEALLSRRLADLDPADRAELALDLSPRELVMDYLEAAFPTRAMEIISDDDSNDRSEKHTSEPQSLMRISYAVFCLKNKIISHSQT